jgi:mono/diheme cytochrome c family protein
MTAQEQEREVEMLRTLVAAMLALAVGVPPVLAAEGAQVYKDQCAKCHGDTGKADTTVGKAVKTPAIAGDAKVADMADADIVKVIVTNPKHAAFIKKVSEADVTAVAAYVKQLAGTK